ncbi:unnamed protein product [Mytilus coruscus]|uniref:Uncharacterized protein n=1 Tax=Mytilus coruscus TaxID=42192 RepID=A0A6J8B111_MYTCO|nr:unnamed protein product [Mytilus coruscus]
MSSKIKTVRAAHRRAVVKQLKKGDPAEEPQQDVVKLQSMMELIKTKQKTLSDLNEKIMEIIEEKTSTEKLKKLTDTSWTYRLESRKLRSTSKNTYRISIKTAVAPVWHHDESVLTNILLDEGAQNSFISQELVEKLHIKPNNIVSMQISAFGGKEGEVRNQEKATLSIETESKERIPMEVIIVPKVAAPIHRKKRVNINSVSYLRGLQLTHQVTHDDKFNISLLVGADYYWSLVQDEIIRGKGATI